MAWIYLAESEDSVKPWRSGSRQLPTVRSTVIVREFYCLVWLMEHFRQPGYGIASARFGDIRFEGRLTLSTLVSPVKTSAVRELERVWRESEAGYFSKSCGSLAKFDRDSYSWRMLLLSEPVGPILSGRKWPAFGMIVDGELFTLGRWEHLIKKDDVGFCWPTPNATDGSKAPKYYAGGNPSLPLAVKLFPTPSVTGNNNRKGASEKSGDGLATFVKRFPTPTARDSRTYKGAKQRPKHKGGLSLIMEIGGDLNPPWVEWLMGYPSGWTVLEDWAMQWFRRKRGKHSKD